MIKTTIALCAFAMPATAQDQACDLARGIGTDGVRIIEQFSKTEAAYHTALTLMAEVRDEDAFKVGAHLADDHLAKSEKNLTDLGDYLSDVLAVLLDMCPEVKR